jgi:hypothetical protein
MDIYTSEPSSDCPYPLPRTSGGGRRKHEASGSRGSGEASDGGREFPHRRRGDTARLAGAGRLRAAAPLAGGAGGRFSRRRRGAAARPPAACRRRPALARGSPRRGRSAQGCGAPRKLRPALDHGLWCPSRVTARGHRLAAPFTCSGPGSGCSEAWAWAQTQLCWKKA